MPLLTIILSALALLALYQYLRTVRTLPDPPGPKPLPFIGNMFDMPVTREYRTYTQWGKEYGDVVYVRALGRHIVILNSVNAARELLDVRSATYSDRPFIPMLHEPSLLDQGHTFGLKPYGLEWRRERRLFSQHLGRTAAPAYFETQIMSTHSLLRSVLDAPDQYLAHIRHAAAETILGIAYGYQIQKTNDPLVMLTEHAMKIVSDGALPGKFLVNVVPWLKYVPAWIPGAGFKRYAAEGRVVARKVLELPFEDAKQRISKGTALPSFVMNALKNKSQDDLVTQHVAGTMFMGGVETSVSVLHSCILGLVLTPATQLRAHAELDGVLGPVASPTFRLPTFADRPYLPYIDAILKESLRWLPIVPVGVPHATTEEDVYRGWRIRKGTIVMANSWSMLRDEETYPDPLSFRPERFLGDSPDPHPSTRGCFGFGRRECPGRYLAEASLWIHIASFLAVFTLSPGKDKEGQPIDLKYAREPPAGMILHPQNFPCIIAARSIEAERRIRETNAEGATSQAH